MNNKEARHWSRALFGLTTGGVTEEIYRFSSASDIAGG